MKIRLHRPFFFQNHLYAAGEIVDLPEGVEGPHGSEQISPDRISYDTSDGLDANRILGEVRRVPRFDEVKDKE